MKWVFPNNAGGQDNGFHNAGVETFKGGNFDHYLARELIQNSFDARLDPNKPVHVKFELLKLDRSEIPEMDYLKATFTRCAEYWTGQSKASDFFKRAETLASQPQVTALRIGDYNTTGVPGSDTDRAKNWYHLVRCAGSSSKGGGEGGSFGIGKNAPFAASRMRTVFYSAFNADNEHVFQGVSTLASHKLPDGATAQSTGFLGDSEGHSIRSKNDIPKRFLRTEHGLDIFILEYPLSENWQRDLIYSVLDNFWPAIDFGELEVSVGDQTVNKANLQSYLDSFSGYEDFTAHLYYRAFKQPTHSFCTPLTKLKDVATYFTVGDIDLPKRIAMVRKTGMVIFHRGYIRSVLPFCGVFICRNEEGNRLLREMEPPRHDLWDPNHPERGANKHIEAEYMAFIRDCISKLAPIDNAKVLSVPGLNRFLPDDDDTPEDAFGGDSTAKQETPERSPLPQKIEGAKISPRSAHPQPPRSPEGTDLISGGEGEGEGHGDGDGGGGGKDNHPVGTRTGQTRPPVPVSYRTFAINPQAGVYTLSLLTQAAKTAEAMLSVYFVGDDQRIPADIKSARLAQGADIPVSDSGVIGPVSLVPKQQLRIEFVLAEPIRVAMEVAAHEA